MNVVDQARQLANAAGGGWLPGKDVEKLMAETQFPVERLMLELIPLASTFSRPPLSGFRVGAVACGLSGALYFGANFEFEDCPLNQTVHAEQTAVVNAATHEETGLTKLAVSAAPCGHCRQFLFELATADQLEIILASKPVTKLTNYLPDAFGPADLGKAGGLLSRQQHKLVWVSPPARDKNSAELILDCAHQSYAPYTNAFGAVGLTTRDGKTYGGPYLENVAFNPSLPPLQSALVVLTLAGRSIEDVVGATIVQTEHSRIDHNAAAKSLLAKQLPRVRIHDLFVRIEQHSDS